MPTYALCAGWYLKVTKPPLDVVGAPKPSVLSSWPHNCWAVTVVDVRIDGSGRARGEGPFAVEPQSADLQFGRHCNRRGCEQLGPRERLREVRRRRRRPVRRPVILVECDRKFEVFAVVAYAELCAQPRRREIRGAVTDRVGVRGVGCDRVEALRGIRDRLRTAGSG